MSKTFDQLPSITPLTGSESIPVNQTSQTRRATVDDFSTYLETSLAHTFASSTHNHNLIYEPKNSNIQEHIVSTTNPHSTTKAQVGLSEVTNDAQVKRSEMGQAFGVATLDAGNKVPYSQLPSTLMSYKGVWDAQTNSPVLADGSGDSGDVYRVTVAGTQFNPPISFEVGDYCIYNGTTWEKSDTTDSVPSVFGRTGPISAQANDYTWGQIDKTTSSLHDITSRSHSLLTDIGTNTHAQIDAAITKLNTIQEGAEVNVNPDWDSTSGDSQIMNKPLLNQDAGTASEPQFTDNLNGSCTIGIGAYNLYSTSDYTGPIKQYTIPGATFTLTDNAMNYIVADYNGGSPIIRNVLSLSTIDDSSVIPIFSIFRVGNNLHNINWDSLGKGLPNKLNRRERVLRRFEIESGLTLSEAATRLVNTTSGVVWYGGVALPLEAAASNLDHTHIWYHSNGAWTFTPTTQYDNNNYDNGTNLTALTANRYSVNWIFRGVYQGVSATNIVLGTGDYTLAQAVAAPLPALPSFISTTNILVGRIIVQKGATSATQIDQVQATTLTQSQATSHEDLLGRSSAAQHPASSISNTPAGSIAATTVQAAIDELASEKAALASPSFSGSPYAPNLRVGESTTYGWSGVSAVDVNIKGAVLGTTGAIGLSYNVYFDGTVYRYKTTDTINQLYQSAVGLYFRTLASGNAGDAVGTWKNIFGIGLNGLNCSVFGNGALLDNVNALQVLGGMAVHGALEDNQTIGSAVTSRLKITNTYGAAFGRLAELQFAAAGSNANQILACISSAYNTYDATNGLGGNLIFSTKYSATDTAPLARMTITPRGNVLIGTTTEDVNYKVLVNGSLKVNYSAGTTYGIALDGTTRTLTGSIAYVGINIPTPTILDANAAYIGIWAQVKPLVPTGVSNGNYVYGCTTNALRNYVAADSDDNGTLSTLVGQSITFGHGNTNTSATPTTTTVKGINIKPYAYYGTITSMYGLYIDSPSGSGTITNKWGVYQADSAFRNYFAGNTLFGTTSEITAYRVYSLNSKTDSSSFAIAGNANMTLTATAGYNMVGVQGQATQVTIPAGVTGSGMIGGVQGIGYVDTANMLGTMQNSHGVKAYAGINNCGSGGIVTNAFALWGSISNASANGTITNAYGCYIDNSATVGTITNRWGFYQVGAAARNYFQGNSLFGTTTENTTTGNAKIQSSNGVYLGNTANSAANVLDWYEEGTFTPVLSGDTTEGTQTYGSQVGKYTRIGRVVHISLRVTLTAKDAAMAGNVIISGLPFVVDSWATSQAGADIGFMQNVSYATTAGYMPTAYLKSGTSAVYMMITKSGAAAEYLQASTITATSDILISATYTV